MAETSFPETSFPEPTPFPEAENESPDDEIVGGDDDGDEGEDELDGGSSERVFDVSKVAQHVGRLSDRAIQRIVGGNAFLRGRQYARRGDVVGISTVEMDAIGRIAVKSDVYDPKMTLQEDGSLRSACTCPGFRGPTGHCKHVAALLVALRDRERPARSRPGELSPEARFAALATKTAVDLAAAAAQTVSAGGKRRRSRRRRRGEPDPLLPVVAVAAVPLLMLAPLSASEGRALFDAWLPSPEEERRPFEIEFRVQVRPASIAVTAVVRGTRTGIPITDTLASFAGVSASVRPALRVLARHVGRGPTATAEVRGEDAAELLSLLRSERVLLDPASMELRFSDDALRPRIELDQANGKTCRVRVVFENKNGVRRFPLSSGAWFEGAPGWHVDTTEGIARPLVDGVTPAWLQRLYRSPALVYPMNELPRLLTEFIPKVAALLGSELPDLSQVADLVDEQPRFRLQTDGDILEARAKVFVLYGEQTFPVPPGQFPSPLAVLPPRDPSGRPRVVRRDVGAEMAAVQQVMNCGFVIDDPSAGSPRGASSSSDGCARAQARCPRATPRPVARHRTHAIDDARRGRSLEASRAHRTCSRLLA